VNHYETNGVARTYYKTMQFQRHRTCGILRKAMGLGARRNNG